MVSITRRSIGLARPQFFLGTFLVVDVGGRADESREPSLLHRARHGLLQMPAIGAVLSAERPGFHRKTLSRAHSFPEDLRCGFAILGVDRGHPGLGMRADEIERLTGVVKPDSIHKIRCPIRLERPGGYRKMLQQPNLELQLLVGLGEFPCSFRDPPIKFTRNLRWIGLCLAHIDLPLRVTCSSCGPSRAGRAWSLPAPVSQTILIENRSGSHELRRWVWECDCARLPVMEKLDELPGS